MAPRGRPKKVREEVEEEAIPRGDETRADESSDAPRVKRKYTKRKEAKTTVSFQFSAEELAPLATLPLILASQAALKLRGVVLIYNPELFNKIPGALKQVLDNKGLTIKPEWALVLLYLATLGTGVMGAEPLAKAEEMMREGKVGKTGGKPPPPSEQVVDSESNPVSGGAAAPSA